MAKENTEVDNKIWEAASDGDLELVKRIVDANPKLANAMDEYGYTPLHAAASWKWPAILTYLIGKGGDPKIADPDGDTPLHVCEDIECAKILLENGADGLAKNNDGKDPIVTTLELECPDVAKYIADYMGVPVPRVEERNASDDDADFEELANQMMERLKTENGDDIDEDALRDVIMKEILQSLKMTVKDDVDDEDAKNEENSLPKNEKEKS
ncbi:hypothetical protein H4219_000229 [Mycoemilia scoparia]|uniref:Uncharacterized protein n=1 Tax=Mycoemilia scoparia TaxID=417184 RepID=A0A9W8AC38_9FUNG|nr:hypothetical protein H4219_000229 [Mycoemilia scoparia]